MESSRARMILQYCVEGEYKKRGLPYSILSLGRLLLQFGKTPIVLANRDTAILK